MFTRVSNASKSRLDCAHPDTSEPGIRSHRLPGLYGSSSHPGAQMISRPLFLDISRALYAGKTYQGNWNKMEVFHEKSQVLIKLRK